MQAQIIGLFGLTAIGVFLISREKNPIAIFLGFLIVFLGTLSLLIVSVSGTGLVAKEAEKIVFSNPTNKSPIAATQNKLTYSGLMARYQQIHFEICRLNDEANGILDQIMKVGQEYPKLLPTLSPEREREFQAWLSEKRRKSTTQPSEPIPAQSQ